MKYRVNPVFAGGFKIVPGDEFADAFEIVSVNFDGNGTAVGCIAVDGNVQMAFELTAGTNDVPEVGDYWTIQEHWGGWVTPKHFFERQYSPVREE